MWRKSNTENNKMKPFNMLIVGKTACGKTKYLLDMLEEEHKGVFEYIFLICPTFEYNKTYRCWKYERMKTT